MPVLLKNAPSNSPNGGVGLTTLSNSSIWRVGPITPSNSSNGRVGPTTMSNSPNGRVGPIIMDELDRPCFLHAILVAPSSVIGSN
ncbi:hypothetical protein F2Q69_00052760 [Brassica cretica]|uniref:Uncharacterized protein n=1 Tax=Brassica cretica TaxID=69181 RepID=A0A8S9MMV9_BRACR|nr:hypothetical protein F2Q69_00052760 [Brassica cretica]